MLPKVVGDEELVARFILSKNEFSPTEHRAKVRLFRDQHDQLSVARMSFCDKNRLVELGTHQVAEKHNPPKILYGWARLGVNELRGPEFNLDVISKALPDFGEHAEIVGWPPPEIQKRLSFEQKLVGITVDNLELLEY